MGPLWGTSKSKLATLTLCYRNHPESRSISVFKLHIPSCNFNIEISKKKSESKKIHHPFRKSLLFQQKCKSRCNFEKVKMALVTWIFDISWDIASSFWYRKDFKKLFGTFLPILKKWLGYHFFDFWSLITRKVFAQLAWNFDILWGF